MNRNVPNEIEGRFLSMIWMSEQAVFLRVQKVERRIFKDNLLKCYDVSCKI